MALTTRTQVGLNDHVVDWSVETFTAEYVGAGEFYSQIKRGDYVTVKVESRHYVWDGELKHAAFWTANKGGASLSVHQEDLVFVETS